MPLTAGVLKRYEWQLDALTRTRNEMSSLGYGRADLSGVGVGLLDGRAFFSRREVGVSRQPWC